MSYHIITYTIYLFISVVLTVWVAHVLFRHGRIFLIDIFHGNQELADSVNKLLVVGFYLINIGYFFVAMKVTSAIADSQIVFEILSVKIGQIILILGAMHFGNLYIFYKLRSRAKQQEQY
jgi:hypothetical protein